MENPDRTKWDTPLSLLTCQNTHCRRASTDWESDSCAPDSDVTFEYNKSCPFMVDCICKNCEKRFTVCTKCPRARSQFFQFCSVIRHCRNAHQEWYDQSDLVQSRSKRRTHPPGALGSSGVKRRLTVHAAAELRPENLHDAADLISDVLIVDGGTVDMHVDDEDVGDPLDDCIGLVDDHYPLHCPVTPALKQEDLGVGCRQFSAAYFYNESKNDGAGLEHLVGMSKFGFPNLNGYLDPDEVMMYAKTAELAGVLTKPNRDRLANLTSKIVDVVKNQTVEAMQAESDKKRKTRPFVIRPLTTPNEIRHDLFDKPKAFFKILPHPPLFECTDHAYSLYSDCVRDALGKGYDLDIIPKPLVDNSPPTYPLRDISSTIQCKSLFNINDHVAGTSPLEFVDLWMNEWSDDADPNSSIKNNRGSFWFKSVTICPTREMIHSMSHTYPLAMGHKNADHEHVGRLLKEDLLMLGSKEGVPMYSRRHGGIVLVRARILACLQDQPERRGENHLMAGNSVLHRRFGYSFPWHKFEDVLRPCVICRDILLDETFPWACPDCSDCTNFAYNLDHPLLEYDAPDFFPIPLEDDRLGPLRLTYRDLVSAVTYAHDALVDGLWCVEESAEWLHLHCLNQKARDSILLRAERCKEFRDIMEDHESTDAEKEAVTAEKEREPNLYARWPIPSLWTRGVLLSQCPDVPMHLLFLGVVKTVMMRVQAWMTNKRKATPFAREMTQYMKSLEALKLTWIKILPYKGGRFGGWVSENYLAMSRILKWFYSIMDRLASDKEPWVEPINKPQDKWKAMDNRAWLIQRGLNKEGLAKTLSARVHYFMTQADPVPPRIDMQAGPVETVLLTISSIDELIALVMIDEIPDESYYSDLERKIRIFLTLFADMEDNLPSKKELPQWLSSYNFMSLLNLPDVIRRYGPIRNIWEGGPQGEGVLRFVKPNMLNGMRRNWELSTMKTLMWKKTMQYVLDQKVGTADSRADAGKDTKLYHPYASHISDLDDMLRNTKEFISCIQVDDGRWGVVWKSSSVEHFLPLNMSLAAHTHSAGLYYFLWERQLRVTLELLHGLSIVAHGLLLPLVQCGLNLGDHGFVANCYSLKTEDHRVIDKTGLLKP